jgi:hypothetical protein
VASVLEHDGCLWKPLPGATSTAEEFIAARSEMLAIHLGSIWNPWWREERASEVEAATAIFEQWTRAEPDFRPLTAAQFKRRMAGWDRQAKARHVKTVKAQENRRASYDSDREAARLALLEQQARHHIETIRRQRLVDHTAFPAMDDVRREKQVAEYDANLVTLREAVGRLIERVGDPETVADQWGWLPAERREHSQVGFSCRRIAKVQRLRVAAEELPEKLRNTTGRAERAEVRAELHGASRDLEFWLAIPPQAPEQMCSECEVPLDWHLRDGHIGGQPTGPCPAWPDWAERLRRVREMLLASAAERSGKKEPEPAAVKPVPIAVLRSGLPIGEVIERLTELQAEHPGAEVRRGAANKWEIWPPADPAIP